MVEFPEKPEDALNQYWLLVWRYLIEMHWDIIAAEQEQNDPYGNAHYSFKSLRSLNCRSKESIDEDVADLARNYWQRNRFNIKEYFVNYTVDAWPDHETYDVLKAVDGSDWIDCGVDPAYPNRKHEFNKWDAKHLVSIGWFEKALKKAIYQARIEKLEIDAKRFLEKEKEDRLRRQEERRRRVKEKINKLKEKLPNWLHRSLSLLNA